MINRISPSLTELVLDSHKSGFLIVSKSSQLLYTNAQAKEINRRTKIFCQDTNKIIHSRLNNLIKTNSSDQINFDSLMASIQPIEYMGQECHLIKINADKPTLDLGSNVNLGLISFDSSGKVLSTNSFLEKSSNNQF